VRDSMGFYFWRFFFYTADDADDVEDRHADFSSCDVMTPFLIV